MSDETKGWPYNPNEQPVVTRTVSKKKQKTRKDMFESDNSAIEYGSAEPPVTEVVAPQPVTPEVVAARVSVASDPLPSAPFKIPDNITNEQLLELMIQINEKLGAPKILSYKFNENGSTEESEETIEIMVDPLVSQPQQTALVSTVKIAEQQVSTNQVMEGETVDVTAPKTAKQKISKEMGDVTIKEINTVKEVVELSQAPEGHVDPPIRATNKVPPAAILIEKNLISSDDIITSAGGKLPQSGAKGFNPNAVQNAWINTKKEGGIVKPGTGDVQVQGGGILTPMKDGGPNQVLLYGFSVTEPGGTLLEINKVFSNIDTAMATVNNNQYLLIDSDGGVAQVDITEGSPRVAIGDIERKKYVDENWIRA